MHFEIRPSNTLMVGITGSHAYGMATEHSDLDIRGVCQTPLDIKLSVHKTFDQFQGDPVVLRDRLSGLKSLVGSTNHLGVVQQPWSDCVIYDVVKACHLMSQANPNMMELLWLPEDCLIYTACWSYLQERRDAFLSTKVQHTYSGYAFAQWRKIASHRSWLLNPPKKKPERADFGLPETSLLSADDRNRIEESVEGVLRGWGIEDFEMGGAERDVLRERMRDFWATCVNTRYPGLQDDGMREVAGRSLGLDNAVLEVLHGERSYRAALKHWNSYLQWKANRNAARAELEAKFGFDTKHGSHLIRLLRMGAEILRGDGVQVRRPDAEELLAIRKGAYTYDQIDELAKKEMAILEQSAKNSLLPKKPDLDTIDQVIQNLYSFEI